jgi:hypothetical protein
MKRMLTLAILAIVLTGCSLTRAFKPTEIVKHPDADMLIQEVKGRYLRVAVYDREANVLIEYGWIKVDDATLKGWTVTKYDWAELIRRRNNE